MNTTTERARNVPKPKMGPLSEDERSVIVGLVGDGVPCNEIARRVGRGRSTVSRVAKAAGLSFDRAQTVAATEANRADAAERLVAGADRFLDARDEALGVVLGHMTSMGARDVKELLVAAGICQDKAAVALAGSRDGTVDAAVSLVDKFFDALGAA